MTPLRLAVLAALVLAAGPAAAAEEVLVLRTQEVKERVPDCGGQNIKLFANVYAPRTRAMDGRVMKEFGNPVGTVVGCGQLPWPITFGSKAPFTMDFDLGGRRIQAAGECVVSDMFRAETNPSAAVLLVGCSLRVAPDESQALAHGIATSASVFMLGDAPGFATGSYWTLHLYTRE